MSIVVFWLEPSELPDKVDPKHHVFSDIQLTDALALCHRKRQEPHVSHVCISSQSDLQVGKMGVDAVEDGKTPDGEAYTWMKRRSM